MLPYAAMAAVDQELDRLERTGVITPVKYSSWAVPIVAVRKPNGKVRVCAEFLIGLNATLDDHQYSLPIPEDIFAELSGGKCFAKLDLTDAYFQVDVHEDSRELLTINPHRGLYQRPFLSGNGTSHLPASDGHHAGGSFWSRGIPG
ncbi:unnamed protein product [Dicrocoelium dendriticum]|nr:unnamed protein product [Dicrocoelium dendriticum]